MADFAKGNDLVLQVATYMFPPVRKDSAMIGKNNRFTPEEAAYYMAYADYLTLGAQRFAAQEEGVPVPNDPDDSCEGDGVRCRAGKCSFWVTWQGEMMPCGMFPTASSQNAFRVPFQTVWEQVKKQVMEIRLPAKCAGCSAKDACRACAAMVITESGDFEKVPQYRCDMIHAYKAQRERLKEELL